MIIKALDGKYYVDVQYQDGNERYGPFKELQEAINEDCSCWVVQNGFQKDKGNYTPFIKEEQEVFERKVVLNAVHLQHKDMTDYQILEEIRKRFGTVAYQYLEEIVKATKKEK